MRSKNGELTFRNEYGRLKPSADRGAPKNRRVLANNDPHNRCRAVHPAVSIEPSFGDS